MLLYLVFYNILAIPILLFLHIKGECSFIEPYLKNVTIPVCSYITNFWFNLLIAELLFVVIIALLYAKIWTTPERKYPHYPPKPFYKRTH